MGEARATQDTPKTGLDALGIPNSANGNANGDGELPPAGFAPPTPPRVPSTPATTMGATPTTAEAPKSIRIPVPVKQPRTRMMTIPVESLPQGGQGLPMLTPRRQPISIAFQSASDTLLVYRVGEDGRERLIPHEFPRSLLDTVGLTPAGVEAFVIRSIVPDYGGGEFIVRAKLANGQFGGEAYVGVDAPSKLAPGNAATPAIPPAPNGVDPRAWAEAFSVARSNVQQAPPGKSIGDAIAEVQAMRTLEKMRGDDGGELAKQIDAKLADLTARISAVEGAKGAAAVAPGESDVDRLIKLKTAFIPDAGQRMPGIDPNVAVLMETVKAQTANMEKMRQEMAEERQKALLDTLKELKAEVAELKKGGNGNNSPFSSFSALKEHISEIRALADEISPPATGSSALDVAQTALAHWTPTAVGDLLERKALSEERVEYAKAQATLIKRKGLPAAGETSKAPMLQRFVPEDARIALIDAKDDDEVLEALGNVLLALSRINSDNISGRIQAIFKALKVQNIEALNVQIGKMVELVFGADHVLKLRGKIVDLLVRQRTEVLERFGQGEASEEGTNVDEKQEPAAPAAPAAPAKAKGNPKSTKGA